jgi:cellobiose phosphorylase
MVRSWRFIDSDGTFELAEPQHSSSLYFPLVNESGLMSVITPMLHGDVKTGQHAFLTLPISVEDLHNTRSARNFWLHIDGAGAWSVTGNSASQIAQNFAEKDDEQVILTAGFLWHQVSRTNKSLGLRAEMTSFVPASGDQVELTLVSITNLSNQPVQFTPTAAIPIYGRSADNLRDHRHVTSLLQRISCTENGVLVRPTLSFDERGHHPNRITYAVLGAEADGVPPRGFFPLVDDFIGEGGSLDWPEAAVRPLQDCVPAGGSFAGYEAIGGLRFKDASLLPGQSCAYEIILGIVHDEQDAQRVIKTYGSQAKFHQWLDKTKCYWQDKLKNLAFHTAEPQFDLWLKWVSLQPTLRRLYGNSFLPYHDYGRGGRGWRDLWQDILALLTMETGQVDHLLFQNFAGVRLDGSNATIVGSQPGEFKADRNNIPRVWMDHGAWPWLTTRLYIDQTGDLAFLLRDQVYFKDHLASRAQAIDPEWQPSQGAQQRTRSGEPYQGSVLEHLLVQHLTAFFNVGEHNQIKLEGADWNDGMDMAAQRGESVAFTALYASNLFQIGLRIQDLQTLGLEQVELADELLLLLDTLQDKIDYGVVEARQQRLQEYFASVQHTISGKKVSIGLTDLAADLLTKSEFLAAHIRSQEWITSQEGYSWFNGYYDNDGQRLEGDNPRGVRMTLTGQVFTLMGGIATPEQAEKMIQAVERYLFDASVGGYRLNTDFKENLSNMGRCFGFAYGHKENGAMFSHMAVMYAYALYGRGFARQAYRALDQIYRQSVNFPFGRMYPGLPEYFTPRGRGVYPYLTGSASWYLLTLLTQAFGVHGQLGDLVLNPKLVVEQFGADGTAGVSARFAGRAIQVIYHNPDRLDYGSYRIARLFLDDHELIIDRCAEGCRISRNRITSLAPDHSHRITVWLAIK